MVANLHLWFRVFAGIFLLSLAGCSPRQELSFDIPSGPAGITLKEFAKQSGVEIVYNAEDMDGISTNPVFGEMNSRQGLERMLHDTPLVITEESSSGAIAVSRDPVQRRSARSARDN